MAGINSILNKIAAESIKQREAELNAMKQAFVPMPGGEAPVDPAAQGMPVDPATGMPMDPAMAGGMPMDPMAAGGGDPAMLAAVSGQAGMPEMMAAQGAPVDPAMAMAGGAPLPQDMMAAPAEAAPAPAPSEGEGKKPSEKQRTDERLGNIEGMLNTIMGALMAKGMLQPDAIPATQGTESEATAEVAPDAVEPIGAPVEGKVAAVQPKKEDNEAIKSLAENLADAFMNARAK
jgi:hypothetical protein